MTTKYVEAQSHHLVPLIHNTEDHTSFVIDVQIPQEHLFVIFKKNPL